MARIQKNKTAKKPKWLRTTNNFRNELKGKKSTDY